MPNLADDLLPDAMINRDDGRKYWETIAADENGMLGGIPLVEGFSNISRIDLQGSRSFLAKLGIGKQQGRRTVASALEGGAGYVFSSSLTSDHSLQVVE